jgi:hypothetical protein
MSLNSLGFPHSSGTRFGLEVQAQSQAQKPAIKQYKLTLVKVFKGVASRSSTVTTMRDRTHVQSRE